MKRILIFGLVLIGYLAPVTAWAQSHTPGRTQNRFPTSSCPLHPSARGYSNMVYDWTTGNAYLFGGTDQVSFVYPLFDIWSYSSFTHRWNLLFNDATFFNAFQADDRALDPQSREVLVFSTFVNCDDSGYCGSETWIYDIATNTFKNVTPAVQPSLRWGYRIAYDTRSKRAILFGGSDGYTGETLNDTWAYDFEANTWTEMRPSNSPPPHHFAAMTYDPLAGKIILFGGFDIGKNESLNDTWAYDAKTNTWTDLQPASPPPARLYHTMAWDIWSNRIIMFGGVSIPYEPILGDTWAFDLRRNTWTQLQPKGSPSSRAWQAMMGTWTGPLLFGGSPTHDVLTDDDTWNYNSLNNSWIEVLPCKTKNRN